MITVHEERDTSGDICRIEVDPRDGRAYIVVTFDGQDAPFELSEGARGQIAWALVGPGISAARETARETTVQAEPVKQGTTAVKTASTGAP